MPRDALLLEEMIEAADQAVALVQGVTAVGVAADRMRRDALLWKLRRPRRGCDAALSRAAWSVPGSALAASVIDPT
jgi:hypothetical protein